MTSVKDQQKLLKDAGKGVEGGGSKIFVEGKTLTETFLKPEVKNLFKGIKSGFKKIIKGEKE
jgi:hypothetical protein